MLKTLVLVTLITLTTVPAPAEETFAVSWSTLMQDKFIGRVRSTIWGAGPTVYDYNTPFFMTVILCPVWEWGNRDDVFHFGSSRTKNESIEECYNLGSTNNHTTWDGRTREIDEHISFTKEEIELAIREIRDPSWWRMSAKPVRNEIGYVLHVYMKNDISIVPLIPRTIGRVGMRSATEFMGGYLVKLPFDKVAGGRIDLSAFNERLDNSDHFAYGWDGESQIVEADDKETFRYEINLEVD